MVGANVTLRERVAPAASVYGIAGVLLIENPVPLAAIWLMVALPLPPFVIVTDCVLEDPVFTLPKAMPVGFAANVAWGAWVPLPERGTDNVVSEALLVIVTEPE